MNILLVGAGALGSRHLQSLADAPAISAVTVVEPNDAAREVALQRWQDVAGHAGKQLSFVHVDALRGAFDAAVIATPSPGRLEVLERVLDLGIPNIVCEKVLFQTVADLDRAVAVIAEGNADVRVNHIYRYAQPLSVLAERTRGKAFSLDVSVGGDGMGCNLIHYLDLLEYLAGDTVSTLRAQIEQPPHPSKRGPSYLEFEGVAHASTGSGAKATVTYNTGPASAPIIGVTLGDSDLQIDEASGLFRSTFRDIGDGAFAAPRVSALTWKILADQRAGICHLPTVADTAHVNRLMLAQFNQQLHGRHDDALVCPIT